MKRSFLTFCILLLIQSLAFAEPAGTNGITADSIVHDLKFKDSIKTHLLAFVSRVDDRPHYVDSALLVMELPNNRWRLVHAIRHPKSGSTNREAWHVTFGSEDQNIRGSEVYDHPPTALDMGPFLLRSSYSFDEWQGYHTLHSALYTETWEKVLKHKPQYKFAHQTS
jgi:hypothetical protein